MKKAIGIGAELIAKNKPKYQLQEWVKFSKGGRTLRGCITWRWYDRHYESWVYDITRNKQTFREVYEERIIERDLTNNKP